jgi:hypothetical protein
LFLATGAAWYYAPMGKAEWRYLNAQTDGISDLLSKSAKEYSIHSRRLEWR